MFDKAELRLNFYMWTDEFLCSWLNLLSNKKINIFGIPQVQILNL